MTKKERDLLSFRDWLLNAVNWTQRNHPLWVKAKGESSRMFHVGSSMAYSDDGGTELVTAGFTLVSEEGHKMRITITRDDEEYTSG